MSRVEVQKLVIELVVDSPAIVKGYNSIAVALGLSLARRLGVDSLRRREFARNISRILEDCYREGVTDPNRVSRRVADWVMEALQ